MAILERTTLGRIAAYHETPATDRTTAFSTSDWTAPTGGTLSVTSGRLRWAQSATAASRGVMHTAIADAADSFVQMLWHGEAGAVKRVGPIARGASGGTLPANMIFARRPGASNPSNQAAQLAEFNTSTVQSQVSGNVQAAPPHRMNLWVEGVARARFRDFSSGSVLNLPGDISTVTDARKCGIIYSHDAGSGTITVDVSEYYRMPSPILTVVGPADIAWDAVVLDIDDNELASASAVAGVAEVDLDAAGVIFPLARKLAIVRTDPDPDEVAVVAIPDEGIWGGDEWEWIETELEGSVTVDVSVAAAALSSNVGAGAVAVEMAIAAAAQSHRRAVGSVGIGFAVAAAAFGIPFNRMSVERPSRTPLLPTPVRSLAGGLIVRTPRERLVTDAPLDPTFVRVR